MILTLVGKTGLGLGLAALALTACGDGNDESTVQRTEAPQATAVGAPTAHPSLDELANALFPGIETEPVPLSDGLWQGAPFVEGGASRPSVGLVRYFLLVGDVTGDGSEESVVLLWAGAGGSGVFNYLAVAGRADEEITILGTAELGDRVQVREGRVADGIIELDVVQAGPEDAACCPTQMATRVWRMGPDGLIEGPSRITGAMTLDELRGPEWVLTELAWEESAPGEPEVTLLFEEERISGNAGCNGFTGGIEESGDTPGMISIGPVGATRMMCPEEIMSVEDRFLGQLGAVSRYSFLAGKLVLSWQDGDSGGVMLFTPREPSS